MTKQGPKLMKAMLCLGGATAAVFLLAAQGTASGASPGPAASPACFNPDASIPLSGASCARVTPLAPPQLTCHLPPDVQGALTQPDLNVRQRAADLFSWQEFLALSWPADPTYRGRPDRTKPITAPGPRVWETWKEPSEVYLDGGVKPRDWNKWPAASTLPKACTSVGATRLMIRDEKIDDVLDATQQAVRADGTLPATLKDQRGQKVRYEIRMNEVAFHYVVNNHLYDANTQARATSISFPNGAILIKAAWRPVSSAEQAAFHTLRACVCDQGASGLTDCRPEQMGLVGLHVTQKTPSASQWIWSTFEHEANVVGAGGLNPSFYDPACPGCIPNLQTDGGVPNQVTRVVPIPSSAPDCALPLAAVDDVVTLNRDLGAALADAGSVLARYQLVNTQWPLVAQDAGTPSTVFNVRPVILSNTTQETFVQETSSCMGCHSTARSVNPDAFVSSDFSFTLNNALPVLPDTRTLAPPKAAVTPWDQANWTAIQRGHLLASRTFEVLGASGTVNAKLHCSSCHLESGRDPDAAWWVGMGNHYTLPGIASRINGCFERSMNGRALCDTGSDGGMGTCANNKDMQALITYMGWLDEQWSDGGFSFPDGGLHRPDGGAPARGYPKFDAGTAPGDVTSGGHVFRQKCAVCHGADGQGRYAHDVYYRPALWGPDSFNACAGMANPAYSGAFVHGNMPLGSGGMLTDREALDVATFIDAQCRPGSDPRTCPGSVGWQSPSCHGGQQTRSVKGAPVTRW